MAKPVWERGEGEFMYKTFNSMITQGPDFALFSDWYDAVLYSYVKASERGVKYQVKGVALKPGHWVADVTKIPIDAKKVSNQYRIKNDRIPLT